MHEKVQFYETFNLWLNMDRITCNESRKFTCGDRKENMSVSQSSFCNYCFFSKRDLTLFDIYEKLC